jgi:hypothetical protein
VNEPLELEPPVAPSELDSEVETDFCNASRNCFRPSLMELVPDESSDEPVEAGTAAGKAGRLNAERQAASGAGSTCCSSKMAIASKR